jgi:hypothetical protein
MEILQWIDTAFRALTAGFFALIPGMTVWTVVLTLYLLVRWIVRSRPHGSVGA